ncbi:hypothetical protein VPH35_030316 [Triticum aestivum]|uniref:HVA22-like protein j n=1 Tax=Triticum aestivum TaxID=4565 RepID=UPI000842CE80|nr:HVA22-like protein j [Triticum aestivum]
MTVVERFLDWTVSWLPMYRKAKLLLILYLCHPSTQSVGSGARVRWLPSSAGGEAQGRHRLVQLELRARARDVTASQLKAAAAVSQVWLFEAIQCVSSQL